MKTRAQSWSASAYQSVSSMKTSGDRAKYRTACMKMPGLIHQSGLVQALVFMVARDDAGRQFVDHLARAVFLQKDRAHSHLIEQAQDRELHDYIALTREVSDVAQWFRRFAQIELKED